jgi:hypothetical protein
MNIEMARVADCRKRKSMGKALKKQLSAIPGIPSSSFFQSC